MLQWLGIGVAIGTLLLTAFVLLLNLTDDTRVAARSTRTNTSMSAEDRAPSFRLAATPARTPVVTAPAVTDFELPDDAPAVQTGGRTAKRPGPRSKPAGKPKAAIRTAPF